MSTFHHFLCVRVSRSLKARWTRGQGGVFLLLLYCVLWTVNHCHYSTTVLFNSVIDLDSCKVDELSMWLSLICFYCVLHTVIEYYYSTTVLFNSVKDRESCMVDEMSRRLSFAIVCSVHKPFSQSLCFHVSVQECEGI